MKKQCMLCHVDDCSLQSDEDVKACPLHKFLSVLGKKWVLLVLLVIEKQPIRYGKIKAAMPDITEKMLITSLRNLETYGYITKEKIAGKNLTSTYTITDLWKRAAQMADEMVALGKLISQYVD